MVKRKFWLQKIENLWKKRSIIWLSGVRRSGKTFLCQSIPEIIYFDCELPRVRKMMEDPQSFLSEYNNKKLAIDEIHKLTNPTELLKIAADHYSTIKIIATGSSTIEATTRFKDSLTGRKHNLMLTPFIIEDLVDFKNKSLEYRFLHGGLPPFFLNKNINSKEFHEWTESFWARDIQELFSIEKRYSFLKFFELLMISSGNIFEATQFSTPCEVSRNTISNYLKIFEETFIVHVIRPFSKNKQKEITSAPKVYGFDTGFTCYFKGWDTLRHDDYGNLWEHFILNELIAKLQTRKIYYWRTKQGHEIDWILPIKNNQIITIEAKWKSSSFKPLNLHTFRRLYPEGINYVVCQDIDSTYSKHYNSLNVTFISLQSLCKELMKIHW